MSKDDDTSARRGIYTAHISIHRIEGIGEDATPFRSEIGFTLADDGGPVDVFRSLAKAILRATGN